MPISDAQLRAQFQAIVDDPATLAQFSEKRQEYIQHVHDALSWWIDDLGNADEDFPANWKNKDLEHRHHTIAVNWARHANGSAELKDVVRSIAAQCRCMNDYRKRGIAA